MKLLCICDPALYPTPTMDVPTFYQRLAGDSRIEVFHVPVEQVRDTQQVLAIPVPSNLSYDEFTQLNQRPGEVKPLSDFDLVFCRRLKPFPPGYLELLAQWEQQVPFVNSPTGKLKQIKPEFFPRVAQAWSPDQLVTDQVAPLQDFLTRYGTIVAKRANSCGGRGVFKLWQADQSYYLDHYALKQRQFSSLQAVLDWLLEEQTEPLLFVRYLQNVTAGDKRIVVVDGKIYGAYLRRSQQGHWVNNVSADGTCELSTVTLPEQVAIEQTVQAYRDLGLHTLGYDFLLADDGHWTISEINAGNIGGFARLELLTGEPIFNHLIDWLIEYSQRQKEAAQFHHRENSLNRLPSRR